MHKPIFNSVARRFGAAPDYLAVTVAPITDEPLTLFCWCYTTTTSTARCAVGLYNTGAASGRWAIQQSGSATLQASKQNDAGGSGTATGSLAQVANQWHAVAATFVSNTSRYCYVDGVVGSEGTTSVTDPTPENITIGARNNSTQGAAWSGGVAHAAIWNVVLLPEEIRELSMNRISPAAIRPESLVEYWPFNYGSDRGLIRGYELTKTGTVLTVDGPRGIRYPSERITARTGVSGAAPSFQPAWATGINSILGA